ncbi:MAG: sigma-54-dependent Fis family transcriptional regulator [Fibrobacteres bacterium]|nr:sigma-54-dependent Fis family transcriptional regulator [Fibrobacterota bacterium]
MTISVKKRAHLNNKNEPTQHIAEIVQKPDHFCLLSRFQNNALTSSWQKPLAGYYPIDITAMQKTIRRHEKISHVMNTLLKNYETGEIEFIGSSEQIQKIRETAGTLANSDVSVLIEGSTGSGKEVLADYIHYNSVRRNGPFIKVDCGTIPRELIESNLFGHEKGAFTGAIAQNKGLFERADGGTLFLDEVSNLSLDTQAKLLRFFNDFTITRVGGNKQIRVNVRCLLASNRNLRDMVLTGSFRADLYYRINVVTLTLPPLKDRQGDIVELCHYYLHKFAALNEKPVKEFKPESLNILREHSWPGNIRELKNVIERAVIFSTTEFITPDLIRLSEEVESNKTIKRTRPRGLLSLSKTDPDRICSLLEQYGGNVSNVAKTLGVGRVSLHLFLNKHNINANSYRKGY